MPATVSLLLSLSHEKGERRIVETITELSDEQGVQYAILSGATVFIIAFEAISLVEKIHPKGMMDPIVSSIFYILCFDPEHFVTDVSRLIEKLQIANPNMAWPRLHHQTSDICVGKKERAKGVFCELNYDRETIVDVSIDISCKKEWIYAKERKEKWEL